MAFWHRTWDNWVLDHLLYSQCITGVVTTWDLWHKTAVTQQVSLFRVLTQHFSGAKLKSSWLKLLLGLNIIHTSKKHVPSSCCNLNYTISNKICLPWGYDIWLLSWLLPDWFFFPFQIQNSELGICDKIQIQKVGLCTKYNKQGHKTKCIMQRFPL